MGRSRKRSTPRGPSGDYDVGYGKPPVASRFPKGRSGNPGGRPRRSPKKEKTLEDFASERISIIGPDGRQTELSRRELAFLQITTKAAKGDHRATILLLEHGRRRSAGEAEPDPLTFDPEYRRSILDAYERQIEESVAATPRKRKSG